MSQIDQINVINTFNSDEVYPNPQPQIHQVYVTNYDQLVSVEVVTSLSTDAYIGKLEYLSGNLYLYDGTNWVQIGSGGTGGGGIVSVNGYSTPSVVLRGEDIKTNFDGSLSWQIPYFNGEYDLQTVINTVLPQTITTYLNNNYTNQLLAGFDNRYVIANNIGDYLTDYYTKTETNALLNAKLSTTVADTTYFKKIGGIINGVDGVTVRGSGTPLAVAPELVDNIYRTFFVGYVKNDLNVEKTSFEIYSDKVLNTINFKAYNPNTTDSILFTLHPTDPPTVTQNFNEPRTLAYVDQIGIGNIQRLIVENLSTTAIANTGTIQTNTINLVENKNEINGATLNNNVITLPAGKYDIKATLNLNKTGNTGKNVQIGLFDTSNAIIRNSVRYASWGTDTIGNHSYDWIGTLDVTTPLSFSVGIVASATGFTYLSDTNTSGFYLSINKIG